MLRIATVSVGQKRPGDCSPGRRTASQWRQDGTPESWLPVSALAMLADRLERRDDTPRSRRARLLAEFPTTASWASHFDFSFETTAAIRAIDDGLAACQLKDSGQLVISMPPQEGKSTLLRWFCSRLLVLDPDLRIAYVSYAANLARGAGRFVRSIIQNNSIEMGISIATDHADAGDWQISGHRGGMVSVGIGGALTGKPVDFLVIDDPLRGQKDADSIKILDGQEDWWRSVARTRFSRTASVVVTQTRWAEKDLAGNRIAEGWPLINIPAVSDGKTPDALDRASGIYLESTRGRTPDDWKATRKDVGERTWNALYMGRPAPLEGGMFKTAWFTNTRVTEAPELRRTIVMIDPADNSGSGDEAGIIVAGTGFDARHYILADRSGHYTVSRWFRVAFLAALQFHADYIGYEKSLSGLDRKVRDEWKQIRTDALALAQARTWSADWSGEVEFAAIAAAAVDLLSAHADKTQHAELRSRLTELWPYVAKVLDLPHSGLPVRAVKPDGSKSYRAQLVSPLFENGSVSLVGVFPMLEHVMATWQEGMPSPDRMDAVVHAMLDLSRSGGSTFEHAKAGPRGQNMIETNLARNSRGAGVIRTRP